MIEIHNKKRDAWRSVPCQLHVPQNPLVLNMYVIHTHIYSSCLKDVAKYDCLVFIYIMDTFMYILYTVYIYIYNIYIIMYVHFVAMSFPP